MTAIYDPQQIKSASKPSSLVLKTNHGQKVILVKKDDMRKDRLVMLFADFIQQVCETKCVRYPVFATKRGGWVEMLPSAKTLYELNYDLSSHIHNGFPRRNGAVRAKPVHSIRRGSLYFVVFIGCGRSTFAEYGGNQW